MDEDERHIHDCKIKERYVGEEEESEDDEDDKEDEKGHKYFYTVELEVKKLFEDVEVIVEHHEITGVPWESILFVDKHYTSDVFLKNAFRHEMKIPDEIFPKAWMNLIPKEDRK